MDFVLWSAEWPSFVLQILNGDHSKWAFLKMGINIEMCGYFSKHDKLVTSLIFCEKILMAFLYIWKQSKNACFIII